MATNESSIRHLRVALGLSREALAARIGISTAWLGQIERQPSFLRPEMARRLAVVLDVPVESLLIAASRRRVPEIF